ncbi:MAG: PRC-barrel domain containing protein [Paraburkholderia sp.]|uniref:PRC-barrel domain-containing protein n=1 Tax=Paraburkholderia sp. TaxID=1926495 RepID=UPI00120D14CB|nr:PRC-barrel domain-containing protein [Paraburkholderia sp.]TAL99050.1 MAG: PRC-barrel domain containing protein [Paraburkholderia sp.]
MSAPDRHLQPLVGNDGANIVGILPGDDPGSEVMVAATLAGDKAMTTDGEHIGHIARIMLDVRGDRIAYAVLSAGGFFGMGDSGASPFQTRAVLAAAMTFVVNPAHVNRPGNTSVCGATPRKHPPDSTYMTLPCGRQRSGTRIANEMTGWPPAGAWTLPDNASGGALNEHLTQKRTRT